MFRFSDAGVDVEGVWCGKLQHLFRNRAQVRGGTEMHLQPSGGTGQLSSRYFFSDCQSDERTSLNAIGSCVVQSQKNAMRSFELTLSFKICF